MCNSVKAVSAPVKVEPKAETLLPGQRVAAYVKATYKGNMSVIDTELFRLESEKPHSMKTADIFFLTIPELCRKTGLDKETLFKVGDGELHHIPAPVKVETKVETKVEPTKLKTRILPGGIKRYVHVFAPALKERFDGKAKDNPLCCVRVGSNPKRFKMYRGVEFLSGASLEELAEPLAGTNGRAICVMVTTGPIRVSY